MRLHDFHNALLKAISDGKAEAERKERIEIARSLLIVLPVETISQTTGLSSEEVEGLK